MRAIRRPARLAAALAGAVAVLAIAPAGASALTCPLQGSLAQYEASDAVFVGQVLERREETAVLAVLEGFKGAATGEVVEIVTGRAEPPDRRRASSVRSQPCAAANLALRVVVADGGQPAATVRVFWGLQLGVVGNPTTVKRVPRSRSLHLRHRYPRTGRVVALVVVEPPAGRLCLSYGSGLPSRGVAVWLRPARRPATGR